MASYLAKCPFVHSVHLSTLHCEWWYTWLDEITFIVTVVGREYFSWWWHVYFAVVGLLSDGDVRYKIIPALLQGNLLCVLRLIVSFYKCWLTWRFSSAASSYNNSAAVGFKKLEICQMFRVIRMQASFCLFFSSPDGHTVSTSYVSARWHGMPTVSNSEQSIMALCHICLHVITQ